MIIKTKGTTTFEQLNSIVEELVAKIENQVGKVDGYKIRDAELGVVLSINNEEQYVTVNHEGLVEIFKTVIQLDESGNVKVAKDNEKESFLDGFTRSQINGTEPPGMTKIESVYNDDELELISEDRAEDLIEQTFKHVSGDTVIRYIRPTIGLVGEMAYRAK